MPGMIPNISSSASPNAIGDRNGIISKFIPNSPLKNVAGSSTDDMIVSGGENVYSAEVENAVLVAIICDRGDRYLSTGIYDQPLGDA